MEFSEIVRHRRMVRRFDRRPVPSEVVDRIVDVGRRAPSAGFSQGLELLVLDTTETVAEFWEITRDPEFGWDPDEVAVGPTVIILPLPTPVGTSSGTHNPTRSTSGWTTRRTGP